MNTPLESNLIEPHLLAYYAGKLTSAGDMPSLVIYKHPSDFPDQFVVRLWCNGRATSFCATAASLEAARDMVPDLYFTLGRAATDDPVIVETWI